MRPATSSATYPDARSRQTQGQCVAVGADRRPVAAVERSARALPSRPDAPSALPELAVTQEPLDRGLSAHGVPRGRHEGPSHRPRRHQRQAADGGRDHRAPVSHRPSRASDAAALGVDGQTTTAAARSTRRARVRGRKPTASGTRSRSGPSPTMTRADALGRPDEARGSPSPRRAGPTNRTCGGSSGSPTSSGIATPLGTTRTSRAPSSRARRGERLRRAEHDASAPNEPSRATTRARARELDVRSPELAGRTACRVFSAGRAEGSQCA